ncbi:MAG: hypothetical protein ACTSWN_17315 [Promethearchaeota archaeon]
MRNTIPSNVIFTASGTRGIIGDGLNPEFIVPLGIAYGTWLRKKKDGSNPSVLIGRDTRPSGLMLESGMIYALLSTGCDIFRAGICPTPAIVQAKSELGLDGAIIISASHNPAEYNGFKFLSSKAPGTFLSNEELLEIKKIFGDYGQHYRKSWKLPDKVEDIDVLGSYINKMHDFIRPTMRPGPPIRIVVDTGAGTANVSTVPLLKRLGCEVIVINDKLLEHPPFFPRESEPIAANLSELSDRVLSSSADLGIALDCDGDRIGLCDEKGNIQREDVGLALIMKNLQLITGKLAPLKIITNVASSLMFEDIAAETGGTVIRTPVGERYLAEKMFQLISAPEPDVNQPIIVGGEGSCGGVMIPDINLARDGTLAAACIVAILNITNKPLSTLISELPRYHLEKVKIDVKGRDPIEIIRGLQKHHENEKCNKILNDLRFSGKDWWLLIHPSNTEPVIRILVEARDKDQAERLLAKSERELREIIERS